jgi:aspartokinase
MPAAAHGAAAKHVAFERERGVYQVLVTQEVAHVVVTVGTSERPDLLLRVFRALADEGIPIFLIKLHSTAVSFAVASARVPHIEECLRRIGHEYSVRPDLALLTVVAGSMRDLTGVMVQIADALQEAGTRIYGVGDSHNSVQCMIERARVEPALEQLKRTFGLEDEDE